MAKKYYDLTQEIYVGMTSWPGHVPMQMWDHDTHESTYLEARKDKGGYTWYSHGITFSDHCGTHVDALSHMTPDPNAPTIEQYPLETFCGPAVCIDVSEVSRDGFITPEILERAEKKLNEAGEEIRENDIVLLYTGAFALHHDDEDFLSRYAGLDYEGTMWLINKKVKQFGIDAPSTDNPIAYWFPSHCANRDTGTTHMENMGDLRPVINKRFNFYGFPLPLRGATGCPIRAVAEIEE